MEAQNWKVLPRVDSIVLFIRGDALSLSFSLFFPQFFILLLLLLPGEGLLFSSSSHSLDNQHLFPITTPVASPGFIKLSLTPISSIGHELKFSSKTRRKRERERGVDCLKIGITFPIEGPRKGKETGVVRHSWEANPSLNETQEWGSLHEKPPIRHWVKKENGNSPCRYISNIFWTPHKEQRNAVFFFFFFFFLSYFQQTMKKKKKTAASTDWRSVCTSAAINPMSSWRSGIISVIKASRVIIEVLDISC